MQEYYFITVFRRLDIDKLGWPDIGESRCWGFYCDKETAVKALHENWTDMEETIYHYAVLEGYNEGISHMTGYQQFFEFDADKNGYFEIDTPNGYEHFIGFSIGQKGYSLKKKQQTVKEKQDVEYTITFHSAQAKTAMKAVELLLRLKLKQFREIPFSIVNIGDPGFCRKRDEAEPLLEKAFDIMLPFGKKDEEWFRLYNIYQALRYAMHEAEYPESQGVDSWPPMQLTDEPIPECKWRKTDESKT